jgi:hypothetical protein avisC_02325
MTPAAHPASQHSQSAISTSNQKDPSMPDQGNISKRLGIFFFYDADGVVDDYVETLLAGMVENLSELVIVVNGDLAAKSYAKLHAFSDTVILRDNVGLDAWAYKTALERVGWARLCEFDEVVLFNATIMGPVYPFSEMFSEMGERDVDFWGITWFHEFPVDPFGTIEEGFIPRHIQSHFMAYRKSLVSSREFQEYWENLPEMHSYIDSVGRHEAPFTRRFERLGFTSDVYVNTEDMEGFTYQPILFAPKKLIEEKRCPIFKRRSFFHPYDDVLDQSVGNATADLYAYLRDHTDFDTDLIWNNALRSMHMADLVKNLQLTYVLPTDVTDCDPSGAKVALVLHVYYLDLLEQTLGYARSMPEGCDIIITVGSQEKAEAVRRACEGLPYRVDVRVIENRGRDVSALLVGVKDVIADYDYVCFAHDKKVTQLEPYSKGEGFAVKCFENILASREFVANVIEQFEKEPRLGLLTPTPPNHAEYFPIYSYGWSQNFVRTSRLLREMKLDVPLSPEKDVIAPLGTMFWFRPAALKPLFDMDWTYEDFPGEPNDNDGTLLHAVERAYGYVAQGSGYFAGWLYSDKFARIELTNLSFYVQELTRAIGYHWPADTEMRMVHTLKEDNGLRRHVKEILRHTIPDRLHSPLRHVYDRTRRIVKK